MAPKIRKDTLTERPELSPHSRGILKTGLRLSAEMLTSFFLDIASQRGERLERREGVAFLNALKNLYEVVELSYLCVNLPCKANPSSVLHCNYSSEVILQKRSVGCVSTDKLEHWGLLSAEVVDWRDAERLSIELDLRHPDAGLQAASFHLAASFGETALLGFALSCSAKKWPGRKATLVQDLRVLAQYFHGNILRLNGHDTSAEILISARELECLKWTAEGKTAQEASEILGISERTVRFHLNAAREKLGCANTTQTVAQAVARHLIKI